MFVSAHLGHWYAELLYLGPVLVVAAGLAIVNAREKRRARSDDGPSAIPDDTAG